MNLAESTRIIDDALQRIVDEVHPIRVVLFGSAARGELNAHSDLDFLIIVPDGTDVLETSFRLHHRLAGLGCPKDIVVASETEVAQFGDNPNLVFHTALNEGRELYKD